MVASLSAAYCFLCFAGRRIMRDLKPFNLKVYVVPSLLPFCEVFVAMNRQCIHYLLLFSVL